MKLSVEMKSVMVRIRKLFLNGKSFFISIALLFVCSSVFPASRGAQELIPSGHWIYDSLMAISLESRRVNFADCAPISIQELKLYLSEIDYDSLSEAGRKDYDSIISYLNEKNFSFGYSILSIGIEPSFNLSGFFKTDRKRETWLTYDADTDTFGRGEHEAIGWIFDRYQRKHVVEMPVTITCGDYLTMSTDLYLGQSKGASQKNFYYSNFPISVDDIDINFPDTGYLSTGIMLTDKVGVGFQLGSGSRSIGRSATGSIIWSDYLTGVSYAQIEAYCPVFKYTGSVSQFNVDKYMYMHQIDFRLFKILQLTALEGMLVYAPLELRFLNPWTIFHGMSPWRDYDPTSTDPESNTCAYLGLKFQLTPVRNLRFYGLYAMTQFQTPYETSNYPDSPTPNGIGAQLGVEAYVPYRAGRFLMNLEGSWADPYLYIKESPNWTLVRTYSENIGEKTIFYEWIGSPFGPDTISGDLKVGYEVPKKYSFNLGYLFMARGEQSGTKVFDRMKIADNPFFWWKTSVLWGGQRRYFDTSETYKIPYEYELTSTGIRLKYNENTYLAQWCYPNSHHQSNWKKLRDAVAPSGTPEFVNRITGRTTLYPNDWLTLIVQGGYVMIFNRDNMRGDTARGFEIALAAEIKFRKK